jgi:hypothetical protein
MITMTFQDLEIYGCEPSCDQCPGEWINKIIDHKIICKCVRCEHGDKSKRRVDQAAKPIDRQADAATTVIITGGSNHNDG